MDISCDIIKDVLPLYAEDMVSNATREMVDEHLCKCDDCTKELGVLKKAQAVPVDVEVKSLKRVGDTIRRRRVLTVMAAMMTLVAFVITGYVFMLTPYPMTAEEAIEGAELREDGGLAIDYARSVNGRSGWGVFDNANYGMMCDTNRYDKLMAEKKDAEIPDMSREELESYIAELYDKKECTQEDWDRFHGISVDYGTFRLNDGEDIHSHDFDPEVWTEENGEWVYRPSERNFWYLNPSNGDVTELIWDGGQEGPNSIIWTTTDAYGYVFFGCLILAAACFVIARGITGIWKEILSRMVILFISVALSTLLVTGGRFTILEYYLTYEWNQSIYMESLVLTLTALLWYQLYRLNKQAKGM